jgi:hypothetical protein
VVEGRSDPVPAPSSIRPELGTAFDEPLAAALSVEPGARPAALAFGSALAGALGRWSRRRPNGTAVAPVAGWVGTPPPPTVGDESPTVVSVPVERGPVPARAARTPRSDRGLPALLGVAAGLLGLLVVLALLAGRPTGPTNPQGSAPAGAAASASPSPSPSPSASASASPSAAGPTDAVAAAIANMRSAISAAGGGKDGLKGRDQKALADRLDRVEREVRNQNFEEAAKAAEELRDRVQELVDKKEVTGERAQTLRTAAQILEAAIPEGD